MTQAGSHKDSDEPQAVRSPGVFWESMIAEQVNIPGKGHVYAIRQKMADGSWETRDDSSLLDPHNSHMLTPLEEPLWPLPGRPADYGTDLELFNENRKFYEHYLELRDKRCYDVMCSYTFMTWRIEEFDIIPYLDFLGPKGRGKSRALELMALLCYRGWLITHPTVAAVFWVVDRYCPTLLADNYEFWPKETRHELDGLFNAGYRKGARVPRRPREGESGEQLNIYKIFCPKALAGIRAPVDSLASRCIWIRMAKNTREVPLKIDLAWAQKLRDKLLAYRFRHFERRIP